MWLVAMTTLIACAAWTFVGATRRGRVETLRELHLPITVGGPVGLFMLFVAPWPGWLVGWAMCITAFWFVVRLKTNVDSGHIQVNNPFRR